MKNRILCVIVLGLLLFGCEETPAPGFSADSSSSPDTADPDTESADNTDPVDTTDTGMDSDSDSDTDSDSDSDTDADGDSDTGSDTSPSCVDLDSDVWCVPLDCNDQDQSIHPEAPDTTTNGVDENCDGRDYVTVVVIDTDSLTIDTSDQDTDPPDPTCIDVDNDWWCLPFDCNDNSPTIYPGATETPLNSIDENCDGVDSQPADTDSGGDPTSCAQAAVNRTYMGCDFWPTVTYNMVWYNFAAQKGFEFAVVVANDQNTAATINITGGALSAPINTTVAAGELKEIILPWVIDLKGTTFNTANTSGNRVSSSVRVDDGAYHMTSSIPVTAWQFSPLEYEVIPVPAGCIDSASAAGHCYSVTNDASLLLPSTAMTGAYRAFSYGGVNEGDWGDAPGGIAITATEDNTLVKVQLSASIAAGAGVAAANAGTTVEYTLNSGDVLELLGSTGAFWGSPHGDLSGSVVVGLDALDPGTTAAPNYKPVQVVGFSPIADIGPAYADHMEETVLPAEVLGNRYIVAPPTGPSGSGVSHKVRFIGSMDGTTLTYQGTTPAGAPTTLSAGQTVQVETSSPFIVTSQDATHPFLVVSFITGAEPSASIAVTPDQFRESYSFLAPTSYQTNYIDVLVPTGATVTLDGSPIGGFSTAIGSTGWSVRRVALGSGPSGDGKHKLDSTLPVGLQVMGYGWATSYYYPGGLKLDIISDPPVIIIE